MHGISYRLSLSFVFLPNTTIPRKFFIYFRSVITYASSHNPPPPPPHFLFLAFLYFLSPGGGGLEMVRGGPVGFSGAKKKR